MGNGSTGKVSSSLSVVADSGRSGNSIIGRCVGLTFCLVWSRWPLPVAAVCGGYSFSDLVVKPGKSCKKFMLTALRNVVSDGENSAACAKATSSGILCVALT